MKRQDAVEKLERALRLAWQRREIPPPNETWLYGVMVDVRRQASRGRVFSDAPRVLWRAAAVVAVVSALLVGSALTWHHGASGAAVELSALITGVDDSFVTGEL